MSVIKAKPLYRGDTVGVVAPASPMEWAKVEEAVQTFETFGCKVVLGETAWKSNGYLAGSDAERATDVNRMFADPAIDAIICLRGGYGTTRILELLDYEMIQCNPKIFVGYSDITALHLAIHQRTGLVTFHGPMVGELASKYNPMSWSVLFQHITRPVAYGAYTEPPGMFQSTIVDGVAEGRLIGGNLSLLTATLGTPFEVDTEGKIFWIEDVEEQPYRIDRMLTQLRAAGKLQQAAGIILADFTRCEALNPERSCTIQQVFHDIVQPLGVPCFYGLKAGHCSPNLTIPYGVMARMDAGTGWLETLEAGVE